MATPIPAASLVGPESLVTVKVLYNDSTRRFKVPLKDLGARVFPQKVHLPTQSPRSDPHPLGPMLDVFDSIACTYFLVWCYSSLALDRLSYDFNWSVHANSQSRNSSASSLASRRMLTSSLNAIPTVPPATFILTART